MTYFPAKVADLPNGEVDSEDRRLLLTLFPLHPLLELKFTQSGLSGIRKEHQGESSEFMSRVCQESWSSDVTRLSLEAAIHSTMEHNLRMGLSLWTIAAIVCNSVVGVLILILFVILYKACKVPSHPKKMPLFVAQLDQKKSEPKYMLTAA